MTAPATKILVTVNGGPIDRDAVHLACHLAREGDTVARMYVVHVIEVNRSLPLSAPLEAQIETGERILDLAEEWCAAADVPVETEMVQARDTGPAIVGEADEWGADLIVMGLPYKRRFGDFNMGKTVPHVLRHAPCQVILYREELAGAG